MVDSPMTRFSSLQHAPAQTRAILRDRFARYLPAPERHRYKVGNSEHPLNDVLLLRLLDGLRLASSSDLLEARSFYEKRATPDELTFDNLEEAGWLRHVWGRIFVSFEIARASSSAAQPMTAFEDLRRAQSEGGYKLSDAVHADAELTDVARALENEELHPEKIVCTSPEWVAARLWDCSKEDEDVGSRLRTWADRWTCLRWPPLVPSEVWDGLAVQEFREAAFQVLEDNRNLRRWEQVRARMAKEVALAQECSLPQAENFLPQIPRTIIDKASWLHRPETERPLHWTDRACRDMFGLAALLLADAEAATHSPVPHPIAERLIGLVLDRPELMWWLLQHLRAHPAVLADLVLIPATSWFACLVVAEWQPPASAWDRELVDRDNNATRAMAFADAASVAGELLRRGLAPPEEAAALLVKLHALSVGREPASPLEMLGTLRRELCCQPQEILDAIMGFLVAALPERALGTAEFAAVLDLVRFAGLAERVDPVPIVESYIRSFSASDFHIDRVPEAALAETLVALAMCLPEELRRRFLYPIDAKERLRAASEAGDNPYSAEHQIASDVRAHIRILCRALTRRSTEAPDQEVAQALIHYVRMGALAHREKGRVAAFAPEHEVDPWTKRERPIASDLGDALGAVGQQDGASLLKAVLTTDEPRLLAQLVRFAPLSMRREIVQGVAELPPAEAGKVMSFPEEQARVDALLSAGLADAAGKYLEEEKSLKTFGEVRGREVWRLRALLRWHYLCGAWDEIEKIVPPEALSPPEQSQAKDTILFFQALADLKKPAGKPEWAERKLASLRARHPGVPAYAVNLFAAQLAALLSHDSFVILPPAVRPRARDMLAEAERMMAEAKGIDPEGSAIHARNKALLLLALDEPRRAHEALLPLIDEAGDDTVVAYDVVALSRAGRRREAIALLDEAEERLGKTDTLRAARNHVGTGAPFATSAEVVVDPDPVPRVREAICTLSTLDPTQQAAAMSGRPAVFETFVAYAIDVIRDAAAGMISLVPMMKSIDIDSREDDLNALVRQLLIGRFDFLQWSVGDQSKGGFTEKGNPGERDVVLSRGAKELAVIEALVYKERNGRLDSKSTFDEHFRKLMSYSTCKLFFLVTYSYVSKTARVIQYLREMAEQRAPCGFIYISTESLQLAGSGPEGFTATYRTADGDVKVVFFVLDLEQRRLREARETSLIRVAEVREDIGVDRRNDGCHTDECLSRQRSEWHD